MIVHGHATTGRRADWHYMHRIQKSNSIDGFSLLPQNQRMKTLRDALSLSALERIINVVKNWFNKATDAKDARYTSVPVWRPWRDF